MTKSEQKRVEQARQLAKTRPYMAAGMLADLHRAALSKRSRGELLDIIEEERLMPYLVQVENPAGLGYSLVVRS